MYQFIYQLYTYPHRERSFKIIHKSNETKNILMNDQNVRQTMIQIFSKAIDGLERNAIKS